MDPILKRISKALRLGKNNNNENEAQAAILAAQRLMSKYKISEEEINGFLDENEQQDYKVIEEQAESETNNDKWKRKLVVTIARNFRCDVYYKGKKLVIVGAKEDILISKRVYLYAKQAILNSFKIFYKENYESYIKDNYFRNKCKREYALGFIDGLSEKFEKQKANGELALVVVNPKVEEYLSNINFSGVHRNRVYHITDSYCYEEGLQKGKKLADIDTELNEKDQNY